MGEYVIFRSNGTGLWEDCAVEPARSHEEAIRRFAEREGATGRFKAVPLRSWRLDTIEIETKQVTLFKKVASRQEAPAASPTPVP